MFPDSQLSLYTLTAITLPVAISGKMELPPGVLESKTPKTDESSVRLRAEIGEETLILQREMVGGREGKRIVHVHLLSTYKDP